MNELKKHLTFSTHDSHSFTNRVIGLNTWNSLPNSIVTAPL